jgi:hypothetical protein
MIDWEETILKQYANSPTIEWIVEAFSDAIRPDVDIDKFFSSIYNIDTADSYGLDCWGKIVDISRGMKISTTAASFGFRGGGRQPFNQAPFGTNIPSTGAYRLSNAAYRKLIILKATSNVTDCSIKSINSMLQYYFADRGLAFVADNRNMSMEYVFNFYLTPEETSILQNSGVFPRPSGVLVGYEVVIVGSTFGFRGTGLAPFGQGVFDKRE